MTGDSLKILLGITIERELASGPLGRVFLGNDPHGAGTRTVVLAADVDASELADRIASSEPSIRVVQDGAVGSRRAWAIEGDLSSEKASRLVSNGQQPGQGHQPGRSPQPRTVPILSPVQLAGLVKRCPDAD